MPSNITRDITYCCRLLREGKLVGIPTETVYGLAANIHDETAIQSIFALKGRPLFNPLIVHVHHQDQVKALASQIPLAARILMDAFWPGPLTLVLPKRSEVSNLITAGKPTVAVRMPGHPFALELLRRLDFPIAAPSANPFTRISPTRAQHVADYFGNRIPAILDGGPCTVGLESTIVGFEGETPIVYRKGGLSLEVIRECVGSVRLMTRNEKAPEAPGMLLKHYSPRAKVVVSDSIPKTVQAYSGSKMGILSFSGVEQANVEIVEILSEKGDLDEAAKNLFAALHRLDEAGLEIIIAERLPDEGLGISINDRLERAGN
ncbi:MAG: L-threonylcarbamoyladenylate synthase [Bacteroidota bacterium]